MNAQNQFSTGIYQGGAMMVPGLQAGLPAGRLECSLKRFDQNIASAADIADRLERLADWICGPTPQEVKNGSAVPDPNHMAGKFERSGEILDAVLGRAISALARLESL